MPASLTDIGDAPSGTWVEICRDNGPFSAVCGVEDPGVDHGDETFEVSLKVKIEAILERFVL